MRKHRRKIITTGALSSQKLAACTDAAERLYWRIYMASDQYGTMVAGAWDVLCSAMPNVSGWDEDKTSKALDELVERGLLERWTVETQPWIHVAGHDRHQAAKFIADRGRRLTPKPPSTTVRNRTEPYDPAPDQEPYGSAPHTTTTTTTTTTKEKPAAVVVRPSPPEQQQTASLEVMLRAAAELLDGVKGFTPVDYGFNYLLIQASSGGFSGQELYDAAADMAAQIGSGETTSHSPRGLLLDIVRRHRKDKHTAPTAILSGADQLAALGIPIHRSEAEPAA